MQETETDIDGDEAEGELRPASELADDVLFHRLKKWFRTSRDHFDKWRTEAKEDYAFVAGDQWTDEEISVLKEQMRPLITFNRIDPVISAVSGTEVGNRQEVKYLPRTQGDANVNEIATNAAKWFRDMCDAEDEESDAFMDALICGVGVTETRLDFEIDEEGAPSIERIDPFEIYPDPVAKKRNFDDGRRVFRARKIPRDDAIALVGWTKKRNMLVGPDGEQVLPEDLDASWASIDEGKNDKETVQESRFYRGGTSSDDSKLSDEVTLVECQWWERQSVHLVADPTTGKATRMSAEDFKTFKERAEMIGMPVQAVPTTMRVYKRAYLGKNSVLLVEDSPFKDHFSYKFITGKRDRNKGSFYGLVRSMKDPQRWANKWLSQTLHIMNVNAKGGMMAEKGAADDEREFEKTFAKPEAMTWLAQGALTGPNGPKIIPKPQTQFPAGFFQLMQYAVQSVPDTSGVNLELLGMKDQEQAGVLEAQRKRQAMANLAVLFDSLRRYRKSQGRLLLFIIQNYLNDERLIRIVGEEGEQYVPLMLDPAVKTYDVRVDDAPSSPQQKEVTWAVMSQMLPIFKEQMTPEMISAILKFSPLPASAVNELQKLINEGSEERAQGQQAAQQLEQAQAAAAVKETESKAMLNAAKAQKEGMPEQGPDPQAEAAKAQGELQLAYQKLMGEMEIAKLRAQSEAEVSMFKAQQEMALKREVEMSRMQLAGMAADHSAGIKSRQAEQQMELAANAQHEAREDA